jgi:excinuclease ABC subunit C
MIYEVLARRARRGAEGWGLPDLIVVDGGKGQLHAALRALREHGAARTAAVALAKARGGEVTEVPDRVFIEGRKNAIRLREGDRVSLFLQRVRDEAHRCALLHHRERRTKELFASELDALAGVGAKRRSLLLAAFGSVRGVAEAPLGALEHILGSRAVARRVKDYFREKGGGGENLKSQIPVERGGWTGGRIECQ